MRNRSAALRGKTLGRHCIALAALGLLAGQLVRQTMQHEAKVKAAQFSPDGRRVVTASSDYTARLWDGTTGQAVGEPMQHDGAVTRHSLVRTVGEWQPLQKTIPRGCGTWRRRRWFLLANIRRNAALRLD